MKNNCNYSDIWQPYINDYDKFEYDIKLKNGTIVENCYPNGGYFNSMSDLHNNQMFNENDVLEIRFSQKPRMGLNYTVSTATMDEDCKKRIEKELNTFPVYNSYLNNIIDTHDYYLPKYKEPRGKKVEVRTTPKINRNDVCPKCDSGLKYKRCCGVAK